MKKYFLVAANSLQENFAYRLNIIIWRLRGVMTIIISYFLWRAIFQSQHQIFGYEETQMLTYIILITFLNGIVLSSQTFMVAEEINRGALSNLLIKPISYFGYVLSRDISNKAINTFFSFFEIAFLMVLLRPPVFIQTSFFGLSFFIFTCILSAFLFFEIGMFISIIGFWSREIWAPRFIFSIVITFLAGTYFPLDILPKPIFELMQFSPFSYLVFFPLKIYLGQMNMIFLTKGFIIMFFWIILLAFSLRFLWKKGLKVYTAEGI